MISTRNSRSLLYKQQSSAARGFHELFWRWSSLEKTSKKYHTRSFQRNATPKCIHLHSRRNSSLSHPSPPIPNNDTKSTSTSIDSPSTVSEELRKLQLLSNEVRKVMRHVPHAVVVLTTPYLYPDDPIHDPARKPLQAAGMTLSSFTTLTLSPDPIITFNIKRPSRTLDALKATQHPDTIALVPSQKERRFHIHILQCNPAGAKIANHFSRGGPISSEDLALLSTRPEKFTKSGQLAQGIRRVFECEILQDGKGGFIDVGDHTLVFGKVRKIHERNKSKGMKETEWKGLCYMQGKYHTPIVMTTPDRKKAASAQKNKVGDEENGLGVEE